MLMSHVSKLEECHCLIYDPLVRRGVLSLIYLELTSARKSVWILGTSLVVWLLRLWSSDARAWVRSLLQEDPTRGGTTKPVRHNY